MKRIEDICFIVYARLQSERLPAKMIMPFFDTTLIDIALARIKRCHQIPLNQFYLCVHEPELIERGKAHGVQIFERSAASANEDSHLPTLMEWWDKLPYTYCVAISGCAPLLLPNTIDNFIHAFCESGSEGMFSVFPRKTYFWNKDKLLVTPWPEGQDLMNTKAVEETYEGVGALYAGRLDTIGDGKWMGSFKEPNDPELFVIDDKAQSMEIDDELEFLVCEALYWKSRWFLDYGRPPPLSLANS